MRYDHLWVNNNGNVTFNGPLSSYTPFGLVAASTPIIAPFFADVDTRGVGSGLVRYGYGETTFEGHDAFCATWINVGYYSNGTDKLNSFQLLLVDRSDKGTGAFDIVFNYDKVQWETGSASGGSRGLGGYSARAGFSSGIDTPGASMELGGSGIPGSFLDSSTTGLIHGRQGSNVSGRYVFQVRDQGLIANKYVALGDSFQSGEGAYDYELGTDQSSNYCHRSKVAYPHLLVDQQTVRLVLDFRACSGALIDDLKKSAVNTGGVPWDEGVAQLDALGPDTKLVTVGIGGNDANFPSVVEQCMVVKSFTEPCSSTDLDDEVQADLDSLERGEIRNKLRKLYREIRARAPYARVVVVSYPRFFPLVGSGLFTLCEGMRVADQQWMNDAVIRADGAIGVAAVSAGFDYVNMAGAFEGHELCTDQPAMNGVRLLSPSNGLAAPESYHPNAYGHEIMADEIKQLLGETVEPSFVILPQQTVTRSVYVSGRSLHVTTAWPGSDVVTTLISPSGVRYDRTNPNSAEHGNGPTYEYFDLENPEHGTWTVEMFGADVDPAGEPVTYSAVDEQVPNLKPTATFTMSGSGATYHFDATESTDSDGSIQEYWWDFGDGTSAQGAVVNHTFPAGIEYRVILGVRDDDGAQDFAAADRTVGSVGHHFSSSISLTNDVTLTGPVHVMGDFKCDGKGTVRGNVFVSGNAYLTNNCRIVGTVRAGGNAVMDSQSHVTGDVIANVDVDFQSTARIGGSITAGGQFDSIDGRTVEHLIDNDIVGGTINPGATVPAFELPTAPPMRDTADVWPWFTSQTWVQWMNATAQANNAPSWSDALTSTPGCTMAPWASSVNGATVHITGDTLIDARDADCARVNLVGMTLELAGDLTIIANGLSAINGLTVQSADGRHHEINIVVPGTNSCNSPNAVDLSAGTQVDSLTSMNLNVAGTLTIDGPSMTHGNASASCFAGTGSVSLGRD